MSDVLNVKKRTTRGTSQAKRERAAGQIPAILYGHGESNESLSIRKDELDAAIRHGSQVVSLQGDLSENAFIREVQWDAFGVDVLHVDFTRVSASEKVETAVEVELRGEAPGAKMGGVVSQSAHSVEILCPAMKIPEKLELTINDLEVGQSLTAADLELPEGASLISEPEMVVVACIEASTLEQDEEAGEAIPGEPEVIGRSADEEDEADG